MTEFQTATLTLQAVAVIASTLIGLGQIAIVWYFGRQMVRANEARSQAGERQEQENQRRHAETMTALQSQGQALAAIGQALDHQGRALETLVARAATEGRQA